MAATQLAATLREDATTALGCRGEVEVEVEGEVEGEGVDPLALKEVGGVGEGVEVEVVERSNIEEVETFCAEVDVVDGRVRGGASSPTTVHCDGSGSNATQLSANVEGPSFGAQHFDRTA